MGFEEAEERLKKSNEAERKIARELKVVLQSQFRGYIVHTGKALLYKIEMDPAGRVSHSDKEQIKRGNFAFETDLLVTKNSIPLVAIELKSGSFSTHDIITYSAKAGRHKQVYPYLRYGFAVFGLAMLGKRFVTHNEAFDFAIALPDRRSIKAELVPLIRRQIGSSERLLEMLRPNRAKLGRYEQTVDIQ